PGSLEVVHHILVFVQSPGGGGDGFGRREGGFGRRSEASQSNNEGTAESGRERRRQGGGTFGNRGGGRAGGGGIGSGNLVAGYAPGMNPLLATDGTTAMHVKAGSKLIFQLHYTPNGTPQPDRSYVGFIFTDPAKVTHVARSTAAAN